MAAEQPIGFDFSEGKVEGFLTEGTADFFESVEGAGGGLHEVDEGEAAFAEEAEDGVGGAVEGEGGVAGEAGEAGGERVEEVEGVLRHGGGCGDGVCGCDEVEVRGWRLGGLGGTQGTRELA